MEQRDYIMNEIEAVGKILAAMITFLLGIRNGATTVK